MRPLEAICELWNRLIKRAKDDKEVKFARTARRVMDFIGKGFSDLYLTKGEYNQFPNGGGPNFHARLNKSQQFVATYMPHLHYAVPDRIVTPSRPQMPPELLALLSGQPPQPGAPMAPTELQKADRVRAWHMQWWTNYVAGEYNFQREGRTTVAEALAKGRGVVWCELDNGVPASFHESVDGLLIDPDCRTWREAGYTIRERRKSRYKLAKEYEIDPEEIEAHYASHAQNALSVSTDTEGAEAEDASLKKDIVIYYEVYSRVGTGSRLRMAGEDMETEMLDVVGDHVWLVIVPGMKYPLNLPPHILVEATTAEIRARLDWPIPFYEDPVDPWPCSALDFLPHSKDPWAKSPLEAGLPLQVFIDSAFSFVMDRVAATSRCLILAWKGLEEKVQDAITGGPDQLVIKVTDNVQDVAKQVAFLTFPEVNTDLYTILQLASREFEDATGMSPLLMGNMGPTQARSSAEVQIRDTRASSRPDDFRKCTETWQAMVARKECIAARLYVGPRIVAPLFGEPYEEDPVTGEVPEDFQFGPLTQTWSALVNTDDPAMAAKELSYSVAVGSGQQKDRQKEIADFQSVNQTMSSQIQTLVKLGEPGPYNAMARWMGEIIERPVDEFMVDPQKLQELLQPPDDGEQEKQQAEMQAKMQELQATLQAKQQEMELKIAAKQQEMQQKQEQQQAEMEANAQESRAELEAKFQEMARDQQEHRQEMVQSEEDHRQKLTHADEVHDQKMQLDKEAGEQKADLDRVAAKQKAELAAKQQAQKPTGASK